MRTEINFKKIVTSTSLDQLITKVTDHLKQSGFGILTRIDFHEKMKEKLNKEMKPVVILGACNPTLAFEAYQKNTDITSLIPCNAVIRQISENQYSVEFTKPSALMVALGETELAQMAAVADATLAKTLEQI